VPGLQAALFRAAADKTAVDTSTVPGGFLSRQADKIAERLKDPDIARHTIEDLFFGMQDNVNDHMDKNHPDYEKTLEQAKLYDRMHFPFLFPVSALTSQIVNNKIEMEKSQNKRR